jgi:hypothetical protein
VGDKLKNDDFQLARAQLRQNANTVRLMPLVAHKDQERVTLETSTDDV